MPNNITNILKAPPSVIAALSGPQGAVDFNSLIPMPAGLMDVEANCSATNLAELICGKANLSPGRGDLLGNLSLSNLLRDLNERRGVMAFDDPQFENFIQLLRNHRAHGFFTWYDWAPEKWGTKWNAYDIEQRESGIKFETAWSYPRPVIQTLVARFPNERIEHLWADEDIGSNCGGITYYRGKEKALAISDPVDFALTVTGNDREYYRKNPTTGMWEFHDAEEAA
jgi:hypothetical protein